VSDVQTHNPAPGTQKPVSGYGLMLLDTRAIKETPDLRAPKKELWEYRTTTQDVKNMTYRTPGKSRNPSKPVNTDCVVKKVTAPVTIRSMWGECPAGRLQHTLVISNDTNQHDLAVALTSTITTSILFKKEHTVIAHVQKTSCNSVEDGHQGTVF
jgi:hypothetical protein